MKSLSPREPRAATAASGAHAAFAAIALVAGSLAGSALYAAEAAAPAVFKADPARGQKIAEPCMACHVADGSRGAPVNPILQGQHPDYLVKQLTEFKAGKRKNAIMNGMAATLSDEDMKQVAAFYAGKSAKPGFAKDKDLVTLGERVYRGGNAASKVPACAGCHSPTGSGIPSMYPRLAGQHSDYTEAQLTAFKAGQRTNNLQMGAIAAKLSERELKAVADYIAGLR